MIYKNGKKIGLIYHAGKAIAYVYKGTQLVWAAIRSCFGSGKWINGKPWLNNENWKN